MTLIPVSALAGFSLLAPQLIHIPYPVSPGPDLQVEEHALGQASELASAQFMTLEDLGKDRKSVV